MMYLESFTFPDADREFDICSGIKRTCYNSFYPFGILSKRYFERIDFEPITILYGGNGSGKTTALNVIAETIGAKREAAYNKSNFFGEYVKLCKAKERLDAPERKAIITSDDVFDYMLSLREMNEGIDRKREEVFDEYLEAKHARFQLRSMDDYEQLKQITQARRSTQSKYVREHLMGNMREQSNGESAFFYFTQKLGENGLYLLDEPENSLSPERQMELARHLLESARFFGCQLVISTHSPFLLAIRGAKIYDLDADPVDIKNWTELKNVRDTYDFFMAYARAFEDD